MSKQTNAVLLVADISGYTKFMKMHEISLNHAKQIVVRLLKSIINAAKPPLTVAELEGDAVFFYAPCAQKDIKKTTEIVKKQIIDLFNSFKKELYIMNNMDVCSCPACIETGDLKLKQVVHTGEIELEKINKSEKLFGVDVIVVHRMLKNSVPSNEYIMMTDQAYKDFDDFYGLKPSPFRENFEGIGEVDTQVFYLEDLNLPEIDSSALEMKKPSFMQKTFWKMKLVPKTFLEIWGIKKIKGNFNNIPA
jgi:hypothetical protein